MATDQSWKKALEQSFHSNLYIGLQLLKRKPVGPYINLLRKWEQLSPEGYAALTLERLAETLAFARSRVPAYRSGLWAQADPNDITTWPVLDRQQVIADPDLFLSGPVRGGTMYRQSSASTGTPLRVAWNPPALAWSRAHEFRSLMWHGIPLGARTLLLWRFASPIGDWVLNRELMLSTNMTPARLEAARRYLLEHRPLVIWGLPSAVAQLARYIGSSYPRSAQPLVPFVKVGGEQVFPFQRREIEQYLGARVVEAYGASETGAIAGECPAGNRHLYTANVYIELMDGGKPVPVGESGEIIATSLTNRAMPLVRIRVGDRARLLPEPCSCGLPYPLVADIEGRSSDLLLASDGRPVHGAAIGRAMESYVGRPPLGMVRQVLFQQIHARRWKVLIEAERIDHAALHSQVSELVWTAFGPGSSIEIQAVPHIPREPSGKYRYYRRGSQVEAAPSLRPAVSFTAAGSAQR